MQIDYREAEASDLEAINQLVDLIFGLGYHRVKRPFGAKVKCFVALVEGKIVGLATGEISAVHFHAAFQKVKSFLPLEEIAIFDLFMVHPDFRKRGIGSQLFQLRLNFFKEKTSRFALIHWKEGVHEKPLIAIRNDFKAVQEFSDFWKEQSLSEVFNCERCGKPPCRCTAILYVK